MQARTDATMGTTTECALERPAPSITRMLWSSDVRAIAVLAAVASPFLAVKLVIESLASVA